jgi:hypothetical protein
VGNPADASTSIGSTRGTPDREGTPAAAVAPAAGDADGRPTRRRVDPALRRVVLARPRARRSRRRRRRRPRRAADGGAATGGADGRCPGRELLVCRRGLPSRRAAARVADVASRDARRRRRRRAGRAPDRISERARTASGGGVARPRRPRSSRRDPRAPHVVPAGSRARARRSRPRDRVAGHADARRAPDRVHDLLHAPLGGHGGAPRVRVHVRARDLPAALPRRRAALFRPGGACRLGAPTEEARCRRTSCCPA